MAWLCFTSLILHSMFAVGSCFCFLLFVWAGSHGGDHEIATLNTYFLPSLPWTRVAVGSELGISQERMARGVTSICPVPPSQFPFPLWSPHCAGCRAGLGFQAGCSVRHTWISLLGGLGCGPQKLFLLPTGSLILTETLLNH